MSLMGKSLVVTSTQYWKLLLCMIRVVNKSWPVIPFESMFACGFAVALQKIKYNRQHRIECFMV